MPADTAPPPEAISDPAAYSAALDRIVRTHRPDLNMGDSGDGPFQRFLRFCAPGFRPSIRADLMGEADARLFADAFDAVMQRQGRPERAHRYGF